MLRKGAPFAFGVLLLLACNSKGEKDHHLSPSMEAALTALGDMPIREIHAGLDGGFTYDAGFNTGDNGSSGSSEETFGGTETGQDIISGVRTNGPTGNGPGNGGVGFGSGLGNGGVGPGGGELGVARTPSVGSGGVSAGSNDGANQLAAVVCDFLNAFCTSLSKCELGKVDLDCEFGQDKCTEFVNEIILRSGRPITVPPNALSGMRCVSNALRSSSCFLTKSGARAFETQVRACGLPIDGQKSEPDNDTEMTGGSSDNSP